MKVFVFLLVALFSSVATACPPELRVERFSVREYYAAPVRERIVERVVEPECYVAPLRERVIVREEVRQPRVRRERIVEKSGSRLKLRREDVRVERFRSNY